MGELTRLGGMFDAVYQRAVANQPHDDSDYTNQQDGLLYCGKCRTPKQYRLTVSISEYGMEEIITPVPCKCETEKLELEERRSRELKDMEIVEKLRKRSLMDERFMDQSFETFHITKDNGRVFQLCKRYADAFSDMLERNQGLLFYGDVGTGKTFAAACIANSLLRKRVPVVMTSFVKLLENAQGRKEDEEKLIAQLNRAKLLIIDDLGAERSSEYALERVYNVVDSRYRAKLPMLLTTNVELKEMQNAIDIRYKRIYDRIFEVCYPVRFSGISFRKNEAKRRWGDMKSFLEGDE